MNTGTGNEIGSITTPIRAVRLNATITGGNVTMTVIQGRKVGATGGTLVTWNDDATALLKPDGTEAGHALSLSAEQVTAVQLSLPSVVAQLSAANTGAQNVAALTNAVAALIAMSPGGGEVVLPQGSFTLAGTVDLDSAYITPLGKTGVTVRGHGIGGTVLTQTTAGVSTFRKSTQVVVNFEGFSLFGSDTANPNSVGIEFTAAAGACLWSNVWISGFYCGSRFLDVTLLTFHNVNWRANARNIELGFNCDIFNFVGCRLDDATDTSVYIGWRDPTRPTGALQCNALQFIGCRISNNATALDIVDYSASNITFLGSYFESNTKLGWIGDASTSVGPKQIHFNGCFFTLVGTTDPLISCRHANQDSTFVFRGNRSDGTGFVGAWIALGLNSRLEWEDNVLLATTRHVTWNGGNYLIDNKQKFSLDNGALIVADGSVMGSFVPLDVRMTNGTSKTYQSWSRRNSATGGTLGISNPVIQDYNGQMVAFNGIVRPATPSSALPTASATYRGLTAYQEGGAGVADTVVCCMKSSADTYSWKVVATG